MNKCSAVQAGDGTTRYEAEYLEVVAVRADSSTFLAWHQEER